MSGIINKNLKIDGNISLEGLQDIFETPQKVINDANILEAGAFLYKGSEDGGENMPTTTNGKIFSFIGNNGTYFHQIAFPDYSSHIWTRYRYYYQGWRWSSWLRLSFFGNPEYYHTSINNQDGFTDLSSFTYTCKNSGLAHVELRLLTGKSSATGNEVSNVTISLLKNGTVFYNNYFNKISTQTSLNLIGSAMVNAGDVISVSHQNGFFYGYSQYNTFDVYIN